MLIFVSDLIKYSAEMDGTQQTMDYGDLIAQFIENQYTQERAADLEDFKTPVVKPEQELSIVEQDIVYRDGAWVVYLIFIDLEHPFSFTRVPVKICHSRRIAEIMASYMRRAHSLDLELAFHASADELDCSLN